MEPERQTSSTTLVLEKQEEKKQQSNQKLVIEPSLSPRLKKLIEEKLDKNVEDLPEIKINLNSKSEIVEKQSTLQRQENLEVIKQIQEKKEQEIIAEHSVDYEPLYNSTNDKKSDITNNVQPKKSKKFRLKLAFCVYALCFTTFLGWTIGNAIAINNQAIILETKQAEYSVNLSSYLIKINGLDGILNEEEKPNTLKPIEAQTTVIPEEMTPPQEYTKKTNWFDNICNWLSNLFRR